MTQRRGTADEARVRLRRIARDARSNQQRQIDALQ